MQNNFTTSNETQIGNPPGGLTALEVVEKEVDTMKTNQIQEQSEERTFRVIITETSKRTITVHESELKEATVDEAVQTVSDWWHNGQIILCAEDFVDVDFEGREELEGR
jgi:hypothetical protein